MSAILYSDRVTDINAHAFIVNLIDNKKVIFVGPSLEVTNTVFVERYFNKNNIKFVLNVAEECRFNFHNIQNITYKKISTDDSQFQDMTKYFNEVHLFIDFAFQNNSCIYLHCAAGISRSITFLISYLMKVNKIPYSDTLKHVKSIRYQAKPNRNFANQLINYEKTIENINSKNISKISVKELSDNELADDKLLENFDDISKSLM